MGSRWEILLRVDPFQKWCLLSGWKPPPKKRGIFATPAVVAFLLLTTELFPQKKVMEKKIEGEKRMFEPRHRRLSFIYFVVGGDQVLLNFSAHKERFYFSLGVWALKHIYFPAYFSKEKKNYCKCIARKKIWKPDTSFVTSISDQYNSMFAENTRVFFLSNWTGHIYFDSRLQLQEIHFSYASSMLFCLSVEQTRTHFHCIF